ncbi:spermatogenesis-associated protein 6 [Megalops cyprinoides]|uniref:spermatogenesis-associated protein 6 n=1 Tax=Megalops cyprinoides TaxID=118141 RepID=UPI001863D85B|nr:spermatogenesis-associated protein 6 [Megalops cyprinoides]
MGGLTPQKKRHSTCKMPQKGLKCTVEVYIQAITCPGVVLPNRQDVYLSVCVMGQYQKTLCLPPVFPLLFHKKMTFEKAFSEAIDPSDIADLLEHDTTSFELIQLVPPEGNILAIVEENTRDFLYPGPRLTPRASGPERELLMKRSISFPGISPKVEFSTNSIIEECELKDSKPAAPPGCPSPAKPRSSVRNSRSPVSAGKRKQQNVASSSYEQPTVASQTRSPSPYTHRRMCQLSEDARQRLSHLQLGPYRFKKESESHPPFVVPRSLSSSLNESASSHRATPSKGSLRHSWSAGRAAESMQAWSLRDESGDWRPRPRFSCLSSAFLQVNSSSVKVQRSPGEVLGQRCTSTPSRRAMEVQSTPASCKRIPQSPVLSHSSLRERFQSDSSSPGQWEEIHRRVQRILRTHGLQSKSIADDERAEGCSAERRLVVAGYDSDSPALRDSTVIPGASVHLGSGAFWTSRAAQYTGKPHRAVFEDSLGKIYKSLYKNASSTS